MAGERYARLDAAIDEIHRNAAASRPHAQHGGDAQPVSQELIDAVINRGEDAAEKAEFDAWMLNMCGAPRKDIAEAARSSSSGSRKRPREIPAPPATPTHDEVLPVVRQPSVFTFGFGDNHNAVLLREIARACGDGLYAHMPDAAAVAPCFGGAMCAMTTVVARNVMLHIECDAGGSGRSSLAGRAAPRSCCSLESTQPRRRGPRGPIIEAPGEGTLSSEMRLCWGELVAEQRKDVMLRFALEPAAAAAGGSGQPTHQLVARLTLLQEVGGEYVRIQDPVDIVVERPRASGGGGGAAAAALDAVSTEFEVERIKIATADAMDRAHRLLAQAQGIEAAGDNGAAIAGPSPVAHRPHPRQRSPDNDSCVIMTQAAAAAGPAETAEDPGAIDRVIDMLHEAREAIITSRVASERACVELADDINRCIVGIRMASATGGYAMLVSTAQASGMQRAVLASRTDGAVPLSQAQYAGQMQVRMENAFIAGASLGCADQQQQQQPHDRDGIMSQ